MDNNIPVPNSSEQPSSSPPSPPSPSHVHHDITSITKSSPSPPSFLNRAWYFTVLWIVRNLFFRLGLGGLKSVGEENMPRSGAVIVAPVHLSFLDPPAVACGTKRRLRFMAKEELFRHWLFGPLIRSLGAFPVRRGEGDTESIRLMIKLLEAGEAVLMFPEGTRGDGVAMNPINRGVGMIAKKTGALVLPVGVVGTHKAWPRGAKKLRRAKVTLVYGQPFTFEDCAKGVSDKEARDLFAVKLGDSILQLCRSAGLELKSGLSSSDHTESAAPEKSSGPEHSGSGETQPPP